MLIGLILSCSYFLKFLRRNLYFYRNSNFYRQINGFTMGGPLSVTFSDIYAG